VSGITADFSGAIAKTKMLMSIGPAALRQAETWGAGTVKDLKISARTLKKSGRSSSALFRSPGMESSVTAEAYKLTIGTGVGSGGKLAEKYASIQDTGGTIKAKGKYLTVPFPGVKGRAKDYPGSFVIKTHGNLFIVKEKYGHRGGGKYVGAYRGLQWLFVLKKQVTLPATHWFSSVINRREPILKTMMDARQIQYVAEKMSGGTHA
jgi:hypothetical protein